MREVAALRAAPGSGGPAKRRVGDSAAGAGRFGPGTDDPMSPGSSETTAFPRITAQALRDRILGAGELALIDVRDALAYAAGHILYAANLPLARLTPLAKRALPRLSVPTVLCDDDGGGDAARAAAGLASLGYRDVSVLDGGIQAWAAGGGVLFSGTNVPSKAFGEHVEHVEGTPSLSARELDALVNSGADVLILDSRPLDEYHAHSIPGGVCVPGAELAYRVHDFGPSPDTRIVVNCAGRTRSIIGAQSLINAGVANVVSLRNGTMGWHLAGLELALGADERYPPLSEAGREKARAGAARVAERFAVRRIDHATYQSWWREREARTLYVFDVRSPEEYEAGHLPGSRSAPGGQLVQETDGFAPVLGARVVLVDDDGVRATMTASWLEQMGGREVAVLENALAAGELERGPDPGAVAPASPEERVLKPYERSEGVEQAMRDYLTWEVALVEEIARDGTAHWLRREGAKPPS